MTTTLMVTLGVVALVAGVWFIVRVVRARRRRELESYSSYRGGSYSSGGGSYSSGAPSNRSSGSRLAG